MILHGFTSGNMAAYAKSDTILASSSVSTEKNEAKVSVSLSGNEGIWGIKFTVKYDHSVLSLSSAKNGVVFSSGDVTMPDTLDKEEFVYFASSNKLEDITKNGVVVTLDFKVVDYASEGKYPIKLTMVQAINVDGENVDIGTEDGEVTIVYDVGEDDVVCDKSQNAPLMVSLKKDGKIKEVKIDKDEVKPEDYEVDKNLNVVISNEYISHLKDGKHKVFIATKEGTTTTDFFVKTSLSKKADKDISENKLLKDKESSVKMDGKKMLLKNPVVMIVLIMVLGISAWIVYILRKIRRRKI